MSAAACAPTTTEAALPDITVGVYNAIADLEGTTGRRLVEGGRVVTPQHPDGHGVDMFVATCSAAPAVRLVVAGLTHEYSTRAARRPPRGAYTHLLEMISVDDPVRAAQPRGADPPSAGPQQAPGPTPRSTSCWPSRPTCVVLAGGIEGGPLGRLLHWREVVVRTVTEQRQREQQAALVGGTVAPAAAGVLRRQLGGPGPRAGRAGRRGQRGGVPNIAAGAWARSSPNPSAMRWSTWSARSRCPPCPAWTRCAPGAAARSSRPSRRSNWSRAISARSTTARC